MRYNHVSLFLLFHEYNNILMLKEFIRFLYIAKGSCGEVRSMLYLAIKLNYIKEEDFQEFYNKSVEISKILSGLIKSLK